MVLHDIAAGGNVGSLADELGATAHVVTADLADPSSAERLWRDAFAWQDRLDVLVNNAGIYEPASVDGDLDAFIGSWNRTLAVCLVTPAALCREAIHSFRTAGGGIIVNRRAARRFAARIPTTGITQRRRRASWR